jgi:hypothetical protein
MLATETPTDGHGPGGKMREADTALRDVLMLSPLATGAKDVHTALVEQFRLGMRNRNPGIGSVFRHQSFFCWYEPCIVGSMPALVDKFGEDAIAVVTLGDSRR